jgi:hypothetical protein
MALPAAINDREQQKFIDVAPGETAVRVAVISGGGGGSGDVNIIGSVPLDVNVLTLPEPLDVNIADPIDVNVLTIADPVDVNVLSFPDPIDVNVIADLDNIRTSILKASDRDQQISYADFATKNERVTQIDYSSLTVYPSSIARKTITYVLESGRYKRTAITWQII